MLERYVTHTVNCFMLDENARNDIPSIVFDGNLVETVECAKLLVVTLSNK